MKNFTFLILLCSINLFSQEISLEKTRGNILYRGVHNSVKAIIETTDCDSVYLKSTDAEIIKINNCYFNIVSHSEKKEITINFYQIKNKDTLFVNKQISRLKNIPPPTFMVMGKTEGTIGQKSFRNLKKASFSAFLDDRFACMTYKISEFKMIVIRNNKSIGIVENIGHKATLSTKELITKVKAGDTVCFLDMKCKVLNKIVELDPVKFEVI
jgi:hypothetical protein